MWKFGCLKGKDKWIFLLVMGLILCILAFPVGQFSEKEEKMPAQEIGAKALETAPAQEVFAKTEDAYETQLENRVREILKHVEGVGKVDVMIVLRSSGEKVWQTDEGSSSSLTEERGENGMTRRVVGQEKEASTVILSKDGEQSPMLSKELYPEIAGVVISAEGGGSPAVQAEISAAMEALFGLPAHKIKVLKRVE